MVRDPSRKAHAGRCLANLSLAGFCLLVSALPAIAQSDPVADFYKGKRLTIIVGSGAGSGYDVGARALAPHLGRHIPGNPTIIVQNMPGGGGRSAAIYLNGAAPRDGTVIAAVQSFIAVDPLFDSSKSTAPFDPRQFTWIGSIASSTSVAVAWHTAPVKNYADLADHELVVGGVGAGTPMVTFPYLFSRLLGMKFKVVAGYLAGPEVDLAMERGEVQGRVDYSWHTLRLAHLDWVKQGKINLLFQLGLQKHPELPDVPLLLDLAKTEEERRILQAAFISYDFGRAFVAPPALPDARKSALRQAFVDTMRDKEFLADADAQQLEVNPVAAERLESLLQAVYSLPPSILASTKALQDPTGAAEVHYKTVRAVLGASSPKGEREIGLLEGGHESIVVGDQTTIMIDRTKSDVAALKPGMTCAIAYLGDKTTAKSLECD